MPLWAALPGTPRCGVACAGVVGAAGGCCALGLTLGCAFSVRGLRAGGDRPECGARSTGRLHVSRAHCWDLPSNPGFTLGPVASADPGRSLGPRFAADPGSTLGPVASADPGKSLGPRVAADPGFTLGPAASADPGTALGPSVAADPGSTSGPAAPVRALPAGALHPSRTSPRGRRESVAAPGNLPGPAWCGLGFSAHP